MTLGIILCCGGVVCRFWWAVASIITKVGKVVIEDIEEDFIED